MARLIDLLSPPETCKARMCLPLPDRRKGGIWHCDLARKNIGKGRKCPPCLCDMALAAGRAALAKEAQP